MKPLLDVQNLSVCYGTIQALRNISFQVYPGEIVSLIGANGAGKTSTMKAIAGLVDSTGDIIFQGKNLSKVPSYQRIHFGVAQSPEGRGIFPQMTVHENLLLGAYHRKDQKSIPEDMQVCFQLFPRIKERLYQMAGTLSGGEQQMLSICRALMAKPQLLLLDEPSLGLAPIIVSQIFQIIQTLHQQGVTILLVEQNARMALKISDRAYVLETGNLVFEGAGHALLNDPRVQECYLGMA